MDDFPYTISLETPGAREVASRWEDEEPSLEVEMPVSDLIRQLKSQVQPLPRTTQLEERTTSNL